MEGHVHPYSKGEFWAGEFNSGPQYPSEKDYAAAREYERILGSQSRHMIVTANFNLWEYGYE